MKKRKVYLTEYLGDEGNTGEFSCLPDESVSGLRKEKIKIMITSTFLNKLSSFHPVIKRMIEEGKCIYPFLPGKTLSIEMIGDQLGRAQEII